MACFAIKYFIKRLEIEKLFSIINLLKTFG